MLSCLVLNPPPLFYILSLSFKSTISTSVKRIPQLLTLIPIAPKSQWNKD